MNRNARLVDGELLEVGSTMTIELGIEIGEQTALEERIICEIDTADNVTRLEL